MSPTPTESRTGRTLTLLGVGVTVMALGVSLVALAFTVHPVHASTTVLWICAALGAGVFAVGALLLHHARRRARRHRRPASQRRVLAAECRRVYDALTAFFAERSRDQPRPGRFGNGSARIQEWNEETFARYRRELRPWAARVFDEVVAYGGASASARPLVEMPSNAQITALRDVFRDAAEALEGLPDH